MKRVICFLVIVAAMSFLSANAQGTLAQPISIFDRFGNVNTLDQLQILSAGTNPVPGGKAAAAASCQLGYFNYYFAPGCGMDGTSQNDIDRRAVVCQVFNDISQF